MKPALGQREEEEEQEEQEEEEEEEEQQQHVQTSHYLPPALSGTYPNSTSFLPNMAQNYSQQQLNSFFLHFCCVFSMKLGYDNETQPKFCQFEPP